MAELKVKPATGDRINRIAMLFLGGQEITKEACPCIKRRLKLIFNSLQKEVDDLIKINGNDKPTD